MLILFNKPYNVLCQFTDSLNRDRLANYITQKNVYAAGRLDSDSEGLLLLTDNGKMQHKISDPKHKIAKTYWVQVENEISDSAIEKLQKGVMLKEGLTRPAKVKKIAPPKNLWAREPPIRSRKNIPTSWLALTLTEGKNRQVRRMTAAVGFPTLRLIRYQIGQWTIDNIANGEYKIIED